MPRTQFVSSSSRHKTRSSTRPTMQEAMAAFRASSIQDLFWDLLTFDRLMTSPVIHIIYWSGLGILLISGCGVIGAAIGMASHEEGFRAVLLGLPVAVVGVLLLMIAALIWRSFCEFYVVVFRISDDLRALRAQFDAGVAVAQAASQSSKRHATEEDSRPRAARA